MIDDKLMIPRNDLKAELWKMIHLNNLVIVNAARRMGKTTLMKTMTTQPTDDCVAIWVDLQHAEDTDGLVENLYQKSRIQLKLRHRAYAGWKKNLKTVSGLKVGPVTFPSFESASWKALLQDNFSSLVSNTDKKVAVFLDEIPLLLHKVITREGAAMAAEMLNVLRSILEQHKPRLSLVYAGSLGLHHILTKINTETKENSPMVNDAHIFSVPTLSKSEGSEVAKRLLESGDFEYDTDTPEAIWHHSNGIPFYIKQITLHAFRTEPPLNSSKIQETVDEVIADPNDVLHIEKDHFLRLRNKDYYRIEDHDFVHEILTIIATWPHDTIDMKSLDSELKAKDHAGTDLKKMLNTLQQDHLLEVSGDKIGFKHPIVKRSWVTHKTIGAIDAK